MKILILEDDPQRIKQFKQRLLESHLLADFTDNAKECISLLKSNSYDLLLMDHDLGGETYVSVDNKNTGSEVARWLSQHPENDNYHVGKIIHSLNPAGQLSMRKLMENVYVYPGIWLEEHFHKVIIVNQEDQED